MAYFLLVASCIVFGLVIAAHPWRGVTNPASLPYSHPLIALGLFLYTLSQIVPK